MASHVDDALLKVQQTSFPPDLAAGPRVVFSFPAKALADSKPPSQPAER